MKDEGNFFGGSATIDETPTRKPQLIAFVIVFLLLLVAIGFAANYFLQTKDQKKTSHLVVMPTVTQIPTQLPSQTPSATPSGSIKKTSTTPTPSVNPKTAVTINVLNGSGVVGAAGTMATSLKTLGYTVNGTGNAATFDYSNVVIEVKKSEPGLLKQLKTDLSKNYSIGSASATLTDSNTTDAIIIVGK
ncbi:MAG TPA: LytR C-terminal domain-containing protein [Patescibacteria group bacterium]|nr:LytR C-terminal domain-containing protein [Patescibacteria group bacterium]